MGFYSKWHNAEVRGQVEKEVRCEKCGALYAYTLERAGVGQEISILHLENDKAQRLAQEYAQADLAAKLQDGCNAVPCPACGWYQAAMIGRAQEGRGWLALRLGIALVTSGTALLGLAWMAERAGRPVTLLAPTGGITLVIGGLLLYLRWERSGKYDPNSAPTTERIEIGRALARLVGRGDGKPLRGDAESVGPPDMGREIG